MSMRSINHILCAVALLAGGAQVSFAYVPEPQPVKSDVEITAIYYPGTDQMSEWDIIAGTCPERKPLLGWFDDEQREELSRSESRKRVRVAVAKQRFDRAVGTFRRVLQQI